MMIEMISAALLHLVDDMVRIQGLEKTLEDIRNATKHTRKITHAQGSAEDAWKALIHNVTELNRAPDG